MTENEFIELTLRYLDGAASQSEVDRLGAAMLDQADLRFLYRDLIQQAQLAHEWQSTSEIAIASIPDPGPKHRVTILASALAAAAATILAFALFLNPDQQIPESAGDNPSAEDGLPEYFRSDSNPSWSDIYRSPFDYPDFVWRAELQAGWPDPQPIDDFSDSAAPPLLLVVAPPSADFNRLLAPIALLPGGENFGNSLY